MYSKLIIYTFIVTSILNVIINHMSTNFDKLPMWFQKLMPFIGDLKPFFNKHTLLAAALIAGFIGACNQYIILSIVKFPKNITNIRNIIIFYFVTFLINILFGFAIKFSTLFPHLETYYYNKLGLIRSMYHDGISGVILQTILLFLSQLINIIK